MSNTEPFILHYQQLLQEITEYARISNAAKLDKPLDLAPLRQLSEQILGTTDKLIRSMPHANSAAARRITEHMQSQFNTAHMDYMQAYRNVFNTQQLHKIIHSYLVLATSTSLYQIPHETRERIMDTFGKDLAQNYVSSYYATQNKPSRKRLLTIGIGLLCLPISALTLVIFKEFYPWNLFVVSFFIPFWTVFFITLHQKLCSDIQLQHIKQLRALNAQFGILLDEVKQQFPHTART